MHSSFVIAKNPDFSGSRRCWTEFSASAAAANFQVAQQLVGAQSRVMAVVKADGYGHGALRMAAACEGLVHSFGVAAVGEAEILRQGGISAPIYLLGPALPNERERIVSGGFRPVISTIEEGNAFASTAAAAGVTLSVHWALDTGMGRIGTLPGTVQSMAAAWSQWTHLHLDSIGSHFPSADEDRDFTEQQSRHFHEMVNKLRKLGLKPDHIQICNSAGIMGYANPPHELVRAGLLLYGVAPFPEMQSSLTPVLTWKSSVTLVRELPANWGVNYGRTFVTQSPTLVATIAAGYADGYLRSLSNQGAEVLIHGTRCPVLGRVTMDQLVVNISHLPTLPEAGTQVVLLGRQGGEEITASELATKAGTIPWEIFTSIRAR